jgi:ABC-2 type transport system permease protein
MDNNMDKIVDNKVDNKVDRKVDIKAGNNVYNPMQKYYKFGLYLVVLVLINLVGATMFFRVDLTSSDLYSLSDASKNVVSTLKEPLTVNVFFSSNLPAPYNTVEGYLHDLLEEYEIYSNDNLSYRFYNVTAAEEGDISEEAAGNRKIAQSYGIHPVNVQSIEQDQTSVQRAYMGIVLLHGDLVEKIPAVTNTVGLEYNITSAIQKMNNKISALVNLPEKIKVHLVMSSSISKIAPVIKLEGMGTLKTKVQEIVEKINAKTYGQLQFNHIDPAMGEGTPEQLKAFDRFGLQWPDVNGPNGTVPAGKGILAIGMSYGDKSVERNLLSRKMALTNRGLEEQYVIMDEKQIEVFLNDNIDNLIDINDDLGYLTSNGTMPLSVNIPPQMRMMRQQMPEELSNLNRLMGKEYTVKQLSLDEEIPESVDTLVIAGPKENFNDWQLFQIDQFLMKGKSLAIFVNAFNEIQPQNQRGGFQQPVYLPLNTGLEKLLDHYGLKVKKSYLLDENCYVNRDRTGGEMPIYFAPIIQNEKINHDHGFMENIKQLIGIKMSPVEADMEKIKKNDLELTEVFASSDKSWEMSGRINLMPFMIKPPQDEKQKKSMPLAYMLEGEFPSYFADRPVPEKPEKKDDDEKDGDNANDDGNDDGNDKDKIEKKEEPKKIKSEVRSQKTALVKGKPGKIFLIGTAEVLKNNVIDENGQSPNAVFVQNMVDYLNNREDIAVMRSKEQRFNPLNSDIKPFTRFFTKAFNIAGLPILFILFGIFVWVRRIARKKAIQAMFAKDK